MIGRLGRSKLLDAGWLLLLAIFILAGMTLTTFHGDEAMLIYMSHDYETAFIDHDPASLMVSPPYYIDDDPWLRILNGSVIRYAIGFSRQLAGLDRSTLPPRPGWDWGLSYDRDVETGHLPSEALLTAARLPSTLFLVISAWVMFGIGWQFGGRLPAYFISALYTVNPVILLNGRRAMMEGSLLCFGILTIWLAILISRGRNRWYWWGLFTLSAGLTIASKHSGIVYLGGAFGWIGLTELIRVIRTLTPGPSPSGRGEKRMALRDFGFTMVKLVVSLIATIAIAIALLPALWNDPAARFSDLIEQRAGLINIQVESDPLAPTTIQQRIEGIITQPFLTPAQQFEVAFWAQAKAITDSVERYMASPLSGLQFGLVLGIPLTLLAGIGLIVALWRWKSWEIGLVLWFAGTAASLLVNPLPWQRYSLALFPVATILAGLGLVSLIQRFRPTPPKST